METEVPQELIIKRDGRQEDVVLLVMITPLALTEVRVSASLPIGHGNKP